MASNKTQPPSTETKMETQEISVDLGNGRQGTVTRQGDLFSLDDGQQTRRVSFQVLVNLARHGEMPPWVSQVPALSERIEAVFQNERDAGSDPFTKVVSERGKLVVTDLKTGSAWGAPITDLKKLAQTGKLPKAFNSPAARRLIDSAA